MFITYAVIVISGVKNRYVIGNFESLDEAKHIANCASLGNADYAYVKDTSGGTVFFIPRPPIYEELDPQEAPLRQECQETAKMLGQRCCPEQSSMGQI